MPEWKWNTSCKLATFLSLIGRWSFYSVIVPDIFTLISDWHRSWVSDRSVPTWITSLCVSARKISPQKNYWVRENVSNRAGANVYVTFLHSTTRVSESVPASLGGRRQITVQWIKQGQGLHLPQPRPWAYPINQTAIPLTVHHSAPETMCMCALRLQQSLLPRSDYRLFMPSLPRSGEQSVLSTDRRSAEPSQWGRMKVENPQNRWWQTGCRVLAGHCCINNRTKIQVM